MCDTYIALGNITKNGNVIFGKNSDRLGSEVQLITHAPREEHSLDEVLQCTHIKIPQAKETYEIILSQPYWMWGAEMGANEYGVVIGNEAIATKESLNETGLLGMDLLRLGLERAGTAKSALETIISLLEKYGQGGYHNKKGLNYHNSWIIADEEEAYVLETAGEWWIVEVVKDFRSISNNISIRGKGDMRKNGIIQHAIDSGYCKDDNDFDFKMIFSPSPLPEVFPIESRDGCSMNQLKNNQGLITIEMMMDFLRTHEPAGICMHKRNNQSTGSQVSEIMKKGKKSIHWYTGSTIPCLSIYKPYVFPITNQNTKKAKPYNEINPNWFWVTHNNYINKFKKKPANNIPERNKYYEKIGRQQKEIIRRVKALDLEESNFLNKEFTNIHQEAWRVSKSFLNL